MQCLRQPWRACIVGIVKHHIGYKRKANAQVRPGAVHRNPGTWMAERSLLRTKKHFFGLHGVQASTRVTARTMQWLVPVPRIASFNADHRAKWR